MYWQCEIVKFPENINAIDRVIQSKIKFQKLNAKRGSV